MNERIWEILLFFLNQGTYPMKNVEVFSVKVGTLLGKGVQGEARDLGYTFVFFRKIFI